MKTKKDEHQPEHADKTAKSVLDSMQANQVGADPATPEDKAIAEAIDIIRSEGKASVSLLQRRSRLGYAEASRIMDELEKRGVVGPAKGGEPRDILALPEVTAPAEKKPKVEVKSRPHRIETVRIRHDFNQEEIANLGKGLAAEQRVAEQIESEAKTCARQYKDKLETAKTKIASLTDKIQEGYEMLPVEAIAMVKINRGGKTATKVFYRKDTGAFIREEDAINAELELFNVISDKTDVTKPLPAKMLASQV